MVLTVTLNPSVDHALFLDHLRIGDTNRVQRTERDAGGKGVNLSRVVAELGGKTTATGFLGGGTGAYIRSVLDRQGVSHDFVEVKGETRTNFSVEDDSKSPPTTFNERGPTISGNELAALEQRCRDLAPGFRWAALGGSLPPGVPPDFYATLGNLLRKAGCRVILDADGEALIQGLRALPNFIKPNSPEASRILGRPVETQDQALRAAEDLRKALDPGAIVVVSRGADGAVLASDEGLWIGVSPQVEARSTIGSGDSMIGGIIWALGEGMEMSEAFRWGLAAGAATATTDGSEIARRPVIERLLPEAIAEPVSAH